MIRKFSFGGDFKSSLGLSRIWSITPSKSHKSLHSVERDMWLREQQLPFLSSILSFYINHHARITDNSLDITVSFDIF